MRIFSILVVAFLCGSVMAAGVPATQPAGDTSNPANPGDRQSRRNRQNGAGRPTAPEQVDVVHIPAPRPMSREYDIIMSRSLFFKGTFVPHDDSAPTSRPSNDSSPGRYTWHPENNIIFRGVTLEGTQIKVLLEDISSYGTKTVGVGQTVGPGMGKITRASLDDLDYLNGDNKTVRVMLGQNLMGVDMDSTTQPVIASGSGESGFSSPSSGSGAPTGPMSDVIAKLKAKRQAELTGGK